MRLVTANNINWGLGLARNPRGAGNELFQTKVSENGLNFFVIRGHQVVTVNVTCKNTFFVFS